MEHLFFYTSLSYLALKYQPRTYPGKKFHMQHILGLNAESSLIKTALLKEEKGAIRLESVKSFFSSDSFVKQLYTSISLPQQQSVQIATSLNPHEVLFRTLSLPIPNRKQALAALPFQLEAILPFPTEEANIAANLNRMGKEAFSISLFASRDSTLESHLQWAQSLHIEPDSISCAPNALYRLCRWLFPQEKNFSIFHFGETKSCCVIVIENEISLSQPLHFGRQDFLQALAKDFPDKTADSLTRDPLSGPLVHLTQVKEKAQKEIERLFHFLKNKNILTETSDWIILGETYPAIPTSLFWTGATPRNIDEFAIPPAILHDYAIPIGTALDALIKDQHSVQFLQGKWIPPRFREKIKKGTIRFASLCLSAALIMGIGSFGLLKKKEKALSEQLLSHLPATMPKNIPQHASAWKEVLWQWESSLNTQKLPFPFIPTVPSVSDLLAWLSAHPTLSSPEGGKKEGIEIKSLHYQLYKYPKLEEPGGGYSAKVELELTAATPRLAREFHDALLKGDQIVNPKKEIKWNSQNTTYWTSFELNPLKKRAP